MDKPLHLEIVSPEKVVFQGDVEMVEMPGKMGHFAILPGHAPIISSLGAGDVRVKPLGEKEIAFPCTTGYVECADNRVSLLLS